MKNYVGSADRLTITTPTAGLVSGVAAIIKGMIVMPMATTSDGEKAAVMTRGEFVVAKDPAEVIEQGDQAFFEPGAGTFTAVEATSAFSCGYFPEGAGAGQATLHVVLTGEIALNSAGNEAP